MNHSAVTERLRLLLTNSINNGLDPFMKKHCRGIVNLGSKKKKKMKHWEGKEGEIQLQIPNI